jgi:hypothetical protein
MYDFYFGTKSEIEANEAKYLLFIKRMLPRWCNSIPDSEYLAIHNSLGTLALHGKKPVLVETGAGASTIALLNYAMKHDGVLYSWDFNGPKGAFLRSVCTDTLVSYYGKNLFDHWKFIAYDSLSGQLGVAILGELNVGVDFCFFDSEHTRNVLLGELRVVNQFLEGNAIVAIDDANYNYIHTNISYINMLRKKIGLPPAQNPADNVCNPFYMEVEAFLKKQWASVEYLRDTYKRDYKADLFWSYYSSDREAMGKEGMEKLDALEHRFDSWRVSGERLRG